MKDVLTSGVQRGFTECQTSGKRFPEGSGATGPTTKIDLFLHGGAGLGVTERAVAVVFGGRRFPHSAAMTSVSHWTVEFLIPKATIP
ncbi:hypothetical protein [Actinoallomurus soli]|uniref:hypothetical protein n=1 Tax=Actinoallomurus soli TaxID=2952535 RepID=UPI002092E43A|nr:hypothetical protein [Actinoallomurus soli]MCO5974569.1 hypothetical protein [Actinoallomurus soli]